MPTREPNKIHWRRKNAPVNEEEIFEIRRLMYARIIEDLPLPANQVRNQLG
jgi:hypothetical protein